METTADSAVPQPPSSPVPSQAEAPSKNALKRELKLKQKEEERLRKEEEKKKKAASAQSVNAPKHQALDHEEEDMDPTQYLENRLKVLVTLKSTGVNPYPHKFNATLSIPDFIKEYQNISKGQHLDDVEVSLAGRIMSKRSSGAKLNFYDLHADGTKVQVMADLRNSGMEEAEFVKHHAGVKRGDIVGIRGFPGKSKMGELSIFPTYFKVLSPCLHMMPRQRAQERVKDDRAQEKESEGDKSFGIWAPGQTRNPEKYILKDQETRYRQRYLDLMVN